MRHCKRLDAAPLENILGFVLTLSWVVHGLDNHRPPWRSDG